MTLNEVASGSVFVTVSGVIAVKTEYFYSTGTPMCILLESGEYAHFPLRGLEPVKAVYTAGYIRTVLKRG